jgi:cytochrome c-type biogenesis protein CcmH
MMLWLLIGLMTAAATFAVLWPLSRRDAAAPSGNDVAVYRDQLDEIERDRAVGLIPEAEAEAARIEVSRRILTAGDADALKVAPSAASGDWRRRAAAVVALIALPFGAGLTYLALGSPYLPGQPIAERRAAPHPNTSLASMVAQVETHLEGNPKDGRGWEVIAPVYMRIGRYNDAVRARRNALELNGETAARLADFGEAMVAAANGVVTADAKIAFERAAGTDPTDVKARYFLGVAAEQDGRGKDAADIWRGMLKDAPANAPWIGLVREALARVDPSPVAGASGPTAADVEAAGNLTAEQRNDMIRGMVARLADRLKTDGKDIDGWLRLVRAYMVLGDRDQARAAVGEARQALAGEPDKVRRLDELAKGLGLEG